MSRLEAPHLCVLGSYTRDILVFMQHNRDFNKVWKISLLVDFALMCEIWCVISSMSTSKHNNNLCTSYNICKKWTNKTSLMKCIFHYHNNKNNEINKLSKAMQEEDWQDQQWLSKTMHEEDLTRSTMIEQSNAWRRSIMIEQGSARKKSAMTEQRNLSTKALEWWLKEKIGNDWVKKLSNNKSSNMT
jgi:hypothetical protein